MNMKAENGLGGSQAGGGLLTVVAVLGAILMLVQGTVYYRAKAGAKLLGSEKNKVLAMQMAEAGVEENVADLGRRTIKVHAGQTDSVTYDNKALEGGHYTSRLTTVAVGDSADTVDLTSSGSVGTGTQSIHTRMRLRKRIASVTVPVATTTRTITDTIRNPATMPALNTTPEWTACWSGVGPNCLVCHLPGAVVASRMVLSQNRATMWAGHGSHTGDYITTAAIGCGLYNPAPDTVNVVTFNNVTTNDTTVKVQFLTWK